MIVSKSFTDSAEGERPMRSHLVVTIDAEKNRITIERPDFSGEYSGIRFEWKKWHEIRAEIDRMYFIE